MAEIKAIAELQTISEDDTDIEQQQLLATPGFFEIAQENRDDVK